MDKPDNMSAPADAELAALTSEANAAAALAEDAGKRLADALVRVNYARALADQDATEAAKAITIEPDFRELIRDVVTAVADALDSPSRRKGNV